MAWRDELQAASFRGVPFHVDSDEATFGRRIQLHEYPQKDDPYAEDLGRKARNKSVTAFVIGDDYFAKRDALITAIEQAGSGELVHPYYGRSMVVVDDDVRVTHTKDEGGMCRFTITFVEAGSITYPSAKAAAGSQLLSAADALEVAAKDDFSNTFSVDDLSEFAVNDAVSTLNNVFDTLDTALSSTGAILSDPLGAISAEIGDLVRTPADLASRLFGLFSKTAAVLESASNFSDIDSLNFARVSGILGAISQFTNGDSTGNTPTRTAMAVNRNAIASITRQALIAQAAGTVAQMDLPVYDDAILLKKDLVNKIETEAAVADDDTYLALTNLRTTVHSDMTQKLEGAARLKTLPQKSVMPGLVLAYDLYEDVSRESEIIARNKIRHPGFVPANPIKVLSA
jgi:prophage DNA circulation protein